jgi:hypothetical protein
LNSGPRFQAGKVDSSFIYSRSKLDISAVDKLVTGNPSRSALADKKDDRNEGANKVNKYGNLKNAWDTYDDTAQ